MKLCCDVTSDIMFEVTYEMMNFLEEHNVTTALQEGDGVFICENKLDGEVYLIRPDVFYYTATKIEGVWKKNNDVLQIWYELANKPTGETITDVALITKKILIAMKLQDMLKIYKN